ncbi:hypothetical protein PR048_011314 [Dryococelus australis]|uniref:Uncharacterized protein n=1 Tax=Dryococelus australis TaxID=614101 RepID=A0ABQ9HL77_9NEOP|nr:hypothetical protein PR048_011314 [Dryococelus australis]
MKPPCKETCHLQCHTKYTQDQRLEIHNSFWTLGNITKQRTSMVNSMTKIEPTQKSMSKRANNFAYYLTVSDRKVRVCKTLFLNTLGVSESWTNYALLAKTIVTSTVITEKTDEVILEGFLSHKILPRNSHYERFLTPKKDQCVFCMQYNNASHEKKVHLEGSYQNHIKNKQISREMKRADVEMAFKNSQLTVCDFDLQSVLQTQCGELSVFYYKRRRNLQYICLRPSHFRAWNAGDSMHSCIEKKKKALKSGHVYVPSQWTRIVQYSKKTETPYHVREMYFPEFHDFNILSAEMGSNFTVDENGDVVTWDDIRVLQVKKYHKYILFYKTDFESPNFKIINFRRRRRGRPLSENFSLTPAYSTTLCISSEKKKDLYH